MLYVTFEQHVVGIKKKISAQCRLFQKVFGNTYYTIWSGHMVYLIHDEQIVDKEFANTDKICNEVLLQWIEKYCIKRVYIRYKFSTIWFLDFLEELKAMNIKSVLEFPTYPYDGEGLRRRPIEDNYYREQIHKYIGCCTTYSKFDSVLNIPCITLVNGVDMNEHPEKKRRTKDGGIVLLAVASFGKWHGYERVIQGMHNYYSNGGKRHIVFNVVGKGIQLEYYRKLIDEYGLQDKVLFHGQLAGEELDRAYDDSDIAIGSLGFYKTGSQSGAPIKLREYCARGIPFICGYDDISFDGTEYYLRKIPNNPEPVDIDEIINFYETVYDGRDFVKDMREYAMSKLTWDNILKPVIEYYKQA